MNNDFPYAGGVRPSWLTTAADDITLTAVSEDNSTWSEWMQWDPALSQNADMKPPLNVQGPACFLKPEQRPPIFNRRQNSQLRESNLGLQPTDIPTSTPMPRQSSNTPFTFGETVELPPAFDFDGNTLSSPSTGEGQQANGFYSPPMWQQQQHHQQHQSNDSSLFSPPRFGNPPVSASTIGPASTPSLHHSPSSLNNGRTSSSSASPEPAPGNAKKRKSSSEDIDLGPAGKKEKGQPVKKTAHNMIEKRYRTNLNDKIAALRDSVPSLRVMSRQNGGNEEDDDPEDLEGLTPAHKLNKATVLSKATEYIRHLEKRNKRLQDEVTTLKGRVESYEKMAISGPMALHGHIATPDGSRFQEDPFTPSHGMPMPGPPQGMIPVPDSIANLHRGMPPQQHYAPAYPSYSGGAARPGLAGPPLVNGRRNNAMMGKLMVGSLAGLMILEGLVEREQAQEESAGKGLFALPPNLASILAPRASFGVESAQVPIAKLLLIFGAVFYIIAPLFSFKPKSKKETAPAFTLSRAPSLASPVEVRRKAWLTAIQTVWVPRHNILLEVAALGLKTLKLSTRQIIGWNGYALLTGITKEQEAARVKAWNIALDAQLTGGDAEISKSRLVLTLMASGTLPDTPARLMLKALHIRVLLWQPANQRHGLRMVDDLSAKLARRFWNMARSEHRIAANLASKPDSDAEPLPDHLAALIERECDEVLVPAIIQRAYNLAWNRPSNEKVNLDPSMDGVVEDFAISSPLDALAAWYSSHVLKKGLACCLATKKGSTKESVKTDLGLAERTAPPTSQAQLRAIVAQAVVFDNNRAEHIAKALEALPSPLSNSVMNIVGDGSVAADIRKALTFAKCHNLIESSDDEAHRRATFAINNTFLPESTTTLLSFAAGYRVLTRFMQDPTLQTECSAGLERIASSLRMWVGHETGRRSGLSNKVRSRIVNHCLDASKTLVGLAKHEEIDDGYVSSSVKGD